MIIKIGSMSVLIAGFMTLILFSISSCYGGVVLPAQWAENAESKAICGMSVEEIQLLAGGRKAIEQNPPGLGMTHIIREGKTSLWLVFKDKKLLKIQVVWDHKMLRAAQYQQRNLCATPQELIDEIIEETKKQTNLP